MLLKENYSERFLEEKLAEYTSTYDDVFNDKFKSAMSLFFKDGLYKNQTMCEVNQFYHEYDLIKEELDVYYMFRDFLKEIYKDLNKRKVADIGAGQIPQLARELAKTSDEEVVAVDKFISQKNNKFDNLKIIEGEFSCETDLGNKNLVVGYHPCDVTMDIITQASKYNSDFAIVVCDCTYMKSNAPHERINGWNNFIGKVDDIVSKSDLGEVYRDKVGINPVIYTNKNKRF